MHGWSEGNPPRWALKTSTRWLSSLLLVQAGSLNISYSLQLISLSDHLVLLSTGTLLVCHNFDCLLVPCKGLNLQFALVLTKNCRSFLRWLFGLVWSRPFLGYLNRKWYGHWFDRLSKLLLPLLHFPLLFFLQLVSDLLLEHLVLTFLHFYYVWLHFFYFWFFRGGSRNIYFCHFRVLLLL